MHVGLKNSSHNLKEVNFLSLVSKGNVFGEIGEDRKLYKNSTK